MKKTLIWVPAFAMVIFGVLLIKSIVPDTNEAHLIGFLSSAFQTFGGMLLYASVSE